MSYGYALKGLDISDELDKIEAGAERQVVEPDPRVIGYMEKGVSIVVVPRPIYDYLDPAEPIVGVNHVMTDGVWMWHGASVYFVKKYKIPIPMDFVEHVAAHGFVMPDEAVVRRMIERASD